MICATASAQLDTLVSHLSRINAFYDSTNSLAFDVRFIYISDTVLGDFQQRENQGIFVMNRNRFYYKLDNIECMQTDSFLVTVMGPEQLIMVAPPSPVQSGGLIPLRAKIDTLTAHNFNGYSYSVIKTDSVNTISLTTTDSTAEFQRISIYYNPNYYNIVKYEVAFDYYPEGDPENGDLVTNGEASINGPRKLVLQVQFENYRMVDVEDTIFSIDRYLQSDGVGNWIGVGRYEGFTVNKMY
jgi:hypothetical protein